MSITHQEELLLAGRPTSCYALRVRSFSVLSVTHSLIDSALFTQPHGRKGGKFKPRSLKELSKQFLGLTIQSGEHDPVIYNVNCDYMVLLCYLVTLSPTKPRYSKSQKPLSFFIKPR